MGEQTPFCRSCFKQAGERFLIFCLEYSSAHAGLWLSRGSGSIYSPVSCFPGCRSDPDPGWCHPPPLTSIPLFSMCLECGAGEQGRGFRSGFCCEGVFWKIYLGTFLTLPLALLAQLWWKNRTEMETGKNANTGSQGNTELHIGRPKHKSTQNYRSPPTCT